MNRFHHLLLLLLAVTSTVVTTTTAFTTTTPLSLSRQSSTTTAFINTNDKKVNNKNAIRYHGNRQHQHVLYMGWGPEPMWSTATLISKEEACPSKKSVILKVSCDTTDQFQIPGQYVQVRLNDAMEKPAFLAIASAPGSGNEYEFLIKRTDSIEWLTDELQIGETFDISQVLGNGYAITENLDGYKYDFPTQNIILCATGSGIAPIASVIRSNALQLGTNSARTCRLYYGERTADDICYVDEFKNWEELGIEVIPVLSQPSSSDDWQGRLGYVQTALSEDGIPIPRNSATLLCGLKGMTESVSDICKQAGMFDGRILYNF